MTDSHDRRIQVLVEDPELQQAIEYMMLSATGMTEQEIADHFNVTRATLYNWRVQWGRSKTYERAREIYLVPVISNMVAAIDRAAEAMPAAIERLIAIATDGTRQYRPSDQITAIKVLATMFALPLRTEKMRPEQEEFRFIETDRDFDATDV